MEISQIIINSKMFGVDSETLIGNNSEDIEIELERIKKLFDDY